MTPTNDSPDSSRIFRYSLEEAKRVKLELEISGGNIVETFATMMSLKLWDDPTKVLWLIMEVQQRGLPKEKPAVIGICTNPLPDPLRVAKEGLESMMHMMKKRASDMMKTDAGRESLRRENLCDTGPTDWFRI